ncbi:complement C1q tumor necrosis factor-related protein 3-like [Sardina pilchardus]|uniref:complement C1q tumor necrosis factor-related protein 3-like n=1 Tax=Sardina pilchardus TaxID=27697 RepID=UPI002E0E01B3
MVVEQRVLLTVTQNELQKVEAENAAVKTEVTNLKMENAAQQTELAILKSRLAATETDMEHTRLAATETDVENLEKEITEQPKVAFSVGLGSGYIESGNTELNLVFTKIITNVGQAYNSMTGFFTAPVRGVYYFRFTVTDHLTSRYMDIMMFKNGEKILHLHEYDAHGTWNYLSSGATLQLEEGDVVNMRLPAGYRLYDDGNNHSTFSGFLLFPL